MFIRKTTSNQGNKTYTNYLLVESFATPKGPRQKTVCSLGNLKPRPREEWLKLVCKVKAALSGQPSLFPEVSDPEVEVIVEKAREFESRRKGGVPRLSPQDDVVAVHTDGVQTEEAREVGPVHVGLQMFKRLDMDKILEGIGFSKSAVRLTQMMVMNRLILPKSEHAMPDWMTRTALSDLLGVDFSKVNDDQLYRNLDRLYPTREAVESALAERERSLFSLEDTLYLYDLTSSYFEGQMLANPRAKRGYSRDHRPDCKQVVIGMVINREGFPRAHEVFEGNRQDRTTVDEMLNALGKRVGFQEGATVVVDRGMAFEENIAQIRARGMHYLVACRQQERVQWLSEFEEKEGWHEIYREVSPSNPGQKKSRVLVKTDARAGETYVLCISDGRKEKDRAIRKQQEKRLLGDLQKLASRIESGKLKKMSAIFEGVGRIKERYPRVARYYVIDFDSKQNRLGWAEKAEARAVAEELDGGYLLKSDRDELDGEELWRTYMLLTRAESAFRDMKSPLSERPIFHQLDHRAQTHIFLCVLAYHLLVAIEHTLRGQGDCRSWETIREVLSTHQVVTVVLPTTSGEELHIRRGTRAEAQHVDIYRKLRIQEEPMKPIKSWHPAR